MSDSIVTTGILGGPTGLFTDGLLSVSGVLAVDGVSPAVVPDDGGVILTVSGSFPASELNVYIEDGTVSVQCYSGVIGDGYSCYSTDGVTLLVIAPKLPEGVDYDIRVVDLDLVDETVGPDLLDVVHRTYTSPLYTLRATFAEPRDPGPRSLPAEDYGSSEIPDDLLRALVSALADTIYEVGGFVMTRLTAPYTAGGGTMTVESTDRFPAAGSIAVPAGVLTYTGVTATTFTGVVGDFSAAAGDPAVDSARSITAMDLLRRAFFLSTADGSELDTIGRNNGFPRPRGVDTDVYRALLSIILYGPSQTTYALELALRAAYGLGNFDIWEDPEVPATVFIRVPALEAANTAGKSYLAGGEITTSDGSDTLDLAYEPIRVYGVWDAVDITRTGTNYIFDTIGGSTFAGGATPTTYHQLNANTPGSFFTAGDLDKTIRLDTTPVQGWRIIEVVDADSVKVAGRTREDARVLETDDDVIETDEPAFASWMVGAAQVQILSTAEGNDGAYLIEHVYNANRARLTGAAFTTEINVQWRLLPKFDSGGTYTVQVDRVSWDEVGKTVTVPSSLTLGEDYSVDYNTTREDDQLMADLAPKGGASPLYIFDHSAVASIIADALLAAGIFPEFPIEV